MTVKKRQYYDICNTFKEWLAKNGHRFDRKCTVRHYKIRELLYIYFEGVTPEITCSVIGSGCIGVSVTVQFRRKCWDILIDFDCNVKRTKDGQYYCSLCQEPLFYATPQELFIAHSFETFLEWVNEHFTSSHVLEIMGARGFTAARIIDPKELSDESPRTANSSDGIMITKIPVIKGGGQ